MIRKTLCGLAALIGALILTLGMAAPAQAQEGHFPAEPWQVRDVECDPYPDCTWSPAASSAVTGPGTVELTKPAGHLGTSAETADLGLTAEADTVLSVDYSLDPDASTAAGAVRLFWYDHPDGDTITEAPTAQAVADADSGTLELAVPAGLTIGTVGLTYDASNDSAGTVTFTALALGELPVLFEQLPAASPSPGPTETAGPTPTEQPSAAPSPTETEQPGEGLPVTSGPTLLPALGIAGGALLGLGGALAWLGRRKRAAVVE